MLFFYIKHYIDSHSKQIGILKALGYSDMRIASGFSIFGLSVFVGCIAGYLLGLALMPTYYGLHQAPDLLIYLRASVPTLVRQIQQRGRKYESSIRIDYLTRLNERYEAWASEYDSGKFLIIDVDNLDFANKPEDLSTVIDKIDAELHGLF